MARRSADGVTSAMMFAVVLGFAALFLCLELIGPPPAWRIDVLWVQGHSRAVRMMIAVIAIAVSASLILFLFRGKRYQNRRIMMVTMWITAVVLCVTVYWDRIPIIYDVVMRYSR